MGTTLAILISDGIKDPSPHLPGGKNSEVTFLLPVLSFPASSGSLNFSFSSEAALDRPYHLNAGPEHLERLPQTLLIVRIDKVRLLILLNV